MKIAIISSFLILSILSARAQNCDIAQTGMAVVDVANSSPVTTVMTGQEVDLKFSIANFGSSMGCSIPSNAVTAILDFPTLPGGTKPYIYTGPSSFVSGFFSWTYDVTAQSLKGINIKPIPNGQGDAKILVRVKAIAPGAAQSNLNLVPSESITDNIANNTSSARLMITGAALPVKLAGFTATPDNCDVELNWVTVSEIGFKHFEVEYCQDGVNFSVVGIINGKSIPTGSTYHFSTKPSNGVGYYRLKLVDIDNKIEYSNTLKVTTDCREKSKIMVYPNPVRQDQKLIVNISGLSGKIRGELFNAAGQRVGDYMLTNSANELSVLKLSAGVYMLYVRSDEGEKQAFRVIVAK